MDDSKRRELHRREVLRGGAAGTAWLLAGSGSALAARQQLAAAEAPAEPLELGFLEGSDQIDDLSQWPAHLPHDGSFPASATGPLPRVLPAAHLTSGDSDLGGEQVTLHVHGLYPRIEEGEWPEFRRITLSALLPAPADAPIPRIEVSLWSTSRYQGVFSLASPVRSALPVEMNGELELGLEVEQRRDLAHAAQHSGAAPAPDAPQAVSGNVASAGGDTPRRMPLQWRVDRYRSRLTVDAWAGQPKLRRGYYLLAIRPKAMRSPRILDGQPLRVLGRSLLLSVERAEA